MHVRTILSAAFFTIMVTSTGASAATLFTTPAHTTRVTVGAVGSATATPLALTSGSATIGLCGDARMTFTITQNNDAAVIGNVTNGALSVCSGFLGDTPTFSTPWRLTVTGSAIVSGTRAAWPAALYGFSYDLLGSYSSGSLTKGVTAAQPVAGTAPICLELVRASFLSGNLYGNGLLDGQYCFIDGAASWSLTN